MHRFYAPGLPREGGSVVLSADESRHLSQVLRLGTGAAVRVFDGHGREHDARVESVGRSGAVLRVGAPAPPAPETAVRVTLAAALLKGDHFDAVVRDATMLGAAAIRPLVTARTEVPAARAGRLDRWRRVAVGAAKQSGRAVVPDIAAPAALAEALAALPRPLIALAEPASGAGTGRIPAAPPEATVLVGPEGGWAPDEIAALERSGAVLLQLGGRTLRADAAPLVALAVLLHEWGAL